MTTLTKEVRAAMKAEHAAEKKAGTTTLNFKDWLAAKNVSTEEVTTTVQAAIVATDTASATTAAEKEVVLSKMHYARIIFKAHLDAVDGDGSKLVRKDIMAQFQQPIEQGGASCKKAGANTYYQNLRDEFGLVTHKA